MSREMKWLVTGLLIVVLPLVTGCFTKSGFNPVADSSLAQAGSQQMVAQSANVVVPQVNAAKYVSPVLPLRKYTYAEPPCSVNHRDRGSLHNSRIFPGCLKIFFRCAPSADHIYINVDEIRVKPAKGQKLQKIDVANRRIDIMKGADISQVLSDAQLPVGLYNYLEFDVSDPKLELNGRTQDLLIPGRKIRFFGNFEIKDGYRTELSIKFSHKLLKIWWWGGHRWMFMPVVRISSTLVAIEPPPPPEVTDGDVNGSILNFVTKAPVSGVTATLEGTSFSAVTGADGKFTFNQAPAGDYTLKLFHPDYLDKTFAVKVSAGQVADVAAEMNPAVIKSAVSNTGWFSIEYPFDADANGQIGEVSMETPVAIDFSSLAFVKAELSFDSEYQFDGVAAVVTYLSTSKQIAQPLQSLGTWWVGNDASFGTFLGEYNATKPMTNYKVDVTEFVRTNPAALYYYAGQNTAVGNVRISNIQLTISYR